MFKVIILAAGQGKRMQSSIPKVLHTIAGKPMIKHVVDAVEPLKPDNIIVVHATNQQTALQAALPDISNIIFAHQVDQFGTGDAVKQACLAHDFSDNTQVLILYGDVPLITENTLQKLLEITPIESLGLLTACFDEPTGFGRIVRDKNNKVVKITEERDADDVTKRIQECNTGILVFSAKNLKKLLNTLTNNNQQQEYYLTDIIEAAVQANVEVLTLSVENIIEVQGVNNRAQQESIERAYQRQQAAQLLAQGVEIRDISRLDIRGDVRVESDVLIDVNVILEGDIKLGAGAKIGANVWMKNCDIGPGVNILPFCHLEGVKIHERVTVGPFARLRPGSELGARVRVGNFVEIKKSIIDQDSKINHLSYIGDATVGKRVNIGAGTITCNYDGVNKHQTIIEDDVHIGSDTQLIAPVTVKAGATLAAGTTLVHEAPAGKLTLTQQLKQRTQEPKNTSSKR